MNDVILKRFDHPDEVRTFEKGKFELIHVGGMTIGRASYEPGWKWSVHVGAPQGLKSCSVEHVGLVVSGRATAAMDDGRVIEMKPRRSVLHRSRTRQLGRRQRAIRLSALYGRGRLRKAQVIPVSFRGPLGPRICFSQNCVRSQSK